MKLKIKEGRFVTELPLKHSSEWSAFKTPITAAPSTVSPLDE